MFSTKRFIIISILFMTSMLFIFLRTLDSEDVDLRVRGYRKHGGIVANMAWESSGIRNTSTTVVRSQPNAGTQSPLSRFRLGSPRPQCSAYSRTMVIPHLEDDDITWILDELEATALVTYVANNSTAPLHPPKNKGHEAMIYISYIIDNYHELPDIIIFMHAHRLSHHNNELLGFDALEMVNRLSSEYVIKEGYVNMRCSWSPGCPEWLHPGDTRETMNKQEQAMLSRSWNELFPSDPLPMAVGQACCAQFALSRSHVLSIPRSRFIFYRDWILRSPLSDFVSGRIWEYLWQFLFTGQAIYCPSERICYCDGFGVCFDGESEYEHMQELRRAEYDIMSEMTKIRDTWSAPIEEKSHIYAEANISSTNESLPPKYTSLCIHLKDVQDELKMKKQAAIVKGNSAKSRLEDCDYIS